MIQLLVLNGHVSYTFWRDDSASSFEGTCELYIFTGWFGYQFGRINSPIGFDGIAHPSILNRLSLKKKLTDQFWRTSRLSTLNRQLSCQFWTDNSAITSDRVEIAFKCLCWLKALTGELSKVLPATWNVLAKLEGCSSVEQICGKTYRRRGGGKGKWVQLTRSIEAVHKRGVVWCVKFDRRDGSSGYGILLGCEWPGVRFPVVLPVT